MDMRHLRDSEPGEPTHIHIPRPSRLAAGRAAVPVAVDDRQLCGQLLALVCGDAGSDVS